MNLLVRFSNTKHKKHTMARAHTIAIAMVCRFPAKPPNLLRRYFPSPYFDARSPWKSLRVRKKSQQWKSLRVRKKSQQWKFLKLFRTNWKWSF